MSVLGEASGHARRRFPPRRRVTSSALNRSEDAHVVVAIVDFAKEARVGICVPMIEQDTRAEDRTWLGLRVGLGLGSGSGLG